MCLCIFAYIHMKKHYGPVMFVRLIVYLSMSFLNNYWNVLNTKFGEMVTHGPGILPFISF